MCHQLLRQGGQAKQLKILVTTSDYIATCQEQTCTVCDTGFQTVQEMQ